MIASPENMKKIAEQIEQWDIAVDVNTVRPRILELHNSDPTQMATLLKTLFSQEMSSRYSFFDYLFGSSSQDKQTDHRSALRSTDVRASARRPRSSS